MKNTLHSIELTNFMCHSNLKITFHKTITCIGGRNGAGKSAIMIALGLLFGQRTHQLERGNSYKDLIKTGTNQAVIRVVLNNKQAFRINRYGEQITIEKRLRENSMKTSVYGPGGKIFNLDRNELESIVDKYGLRFENPLNFLTQERSKKLLSIKSEELYSFYYNGTEFKNIEEDLNESKEILNDINKKLEAVNNKEMELDQRLSMQKKNLEFLEFDFEGALKRLDNEEKCNKIHQYRTQSEELRQVSEEMHKSIEKRREERSKVIEIEYVSNKEEVEELSKMKVKQHSIEVELKEYKEELTAMRVNKSKIPEDFSGAELHKLVESLEEKKKRLESLEQLRIKAFQNHQLEKDRNREGQMRMEALRGEMEKLGQNFVAGTKKQKLDQNFADPNKKQDLENFGRIQAEISRNAFRDEVVGPVCNYIQLKDYRWYKTASIVLKKSLTNFIVFNSEDKLKLHRIFQRLEVNYSVSQMRSKVNYSDLKMNSEFTTLYDILAISSPVVANQLITLNNIEQIILIEDRSKAYRVIKERPRHVESAYTIKGDRIRLVNGSLSDFRPKDESSYWFENRESKMKKLEEEMKKISIKDECRREYNGVNEELNRLIGEVEGEEKAIERLRIVLEAQATAKENDAVERKEGVLARRVELLETKRAEVVGRIGELEGGIRGVEETNRRLREERRRQEAGRAAMDDEILVMETRVQRVENDRSVIENEISRLCMSDGFDMAGAEGGVRSSEQINKERREVHQRRLMAKEMQGRDEIARELGRLGQELGALRELKSKFDSTVGEALQAWEKRVEKREEIKNKNTEIATGLFRDYAKRSGYEGEMEIDHENRKLELSLRVHNSTVTGSKSTLSGGERSFAGVCFLLSLWACFKCPVRILDEFDVFMDSLNRKAAIGLLFEYFKGAGVQGVLITPLGTGDLIDVDCEIQVIE